MDILRKIKELMVKTKFMFPAIPLMVLAAGLFLYHYYYIRDLPAWIKFATIILGSFLYYTSEGTTEGYTFKADHICIHRKQFLNWHINQLMYHLFRLGEAFGFMLMLMGTMAFVAYNRWYILGIMICSVICYPMYKVMLKEKWRL